MSITIDAHVLHSLPLSNPNRDEYGSPKTAVYGAVERSRISSACLKRGCRIKIEEILGDRALRTRRVPSEVAAELVRRGWDAQEATEAGEAVVLAAGVKGLAITEAGVTSVMLYLPAAGISLLADLVEAHRDTIAAAAQQAKAKADADAAKGKKTAPKTKVPKLDKETDQKVKAVKQQVLEIIASRNGAIAAFGRMLANTPEVTVDGAIAAAHAITTHAADEQRDFFTAVDDVTGTDNGSAHMGNAAYTSGTFYRYSTINVDELLRNLDGDREAATELTRAFLTEFARYTPTAKKNSTAPFTPPALVYFAVRADQPVNLEGAFEAPVTADDTSGWTAPSITALDQHAAATHAFYGTDALLTEAHSGTAPNLGTLTALGPRIPGLKDLVETVIAAALPEAGQ